MVICIATGSVHFLLKMTTCSYPKISTVDMATGSVHFLLKMTTCSYPEISTVDISLKLERELIMGSFVGAVLVCSKSSPKAQIVPVQQLVNKIHPLMDGG